MTSEQQKPDERIGRTARRVARWLTQNPGGKGGMHWTDRVARASRIAEAEAITSGEIDEWVNWKVSHACERIVLRKVDDFAPWLPEWWLTGEAHRELSALLPEWTRLMAAAPAMVRALLECEWGGDDDCPGCVAFDQSGRPSEHEPDCPLDAALTAAGFPDQKTRDAARRRLA